MSQPTTAPTNSLVYLDTETTGLDPLRHDVIECAWAVDNAPVQTATFDHDLAHADPRALEVNHYWSRGFIQAARAHGEPPRAHGAGHKRLIGDLTGATLVAEHYGFDVAMLLRKIGFEPWHYRKIELSSVAMTVFDLPRPESLRDTRARLLDLGYDVPEGDHTARADVECLRACYLALRVVRGRHGYPSTRLETTIGR